MKLKPLNKKGQVGLDMIKGIILALMTLAVIAFAIVIMLNALSDADTSDAGSTQANQTSSILSNVTEGTADLFSNTGTWLALAAIVVIILIIAVVIIAVNKFGGRGGGL